MENNPYKKSIKCKKVKAMLKKNIIKLLFALFFGLIFALFFIKIKTDVYVGNYSWCSCSIDIQIEIDGKKMIKDSLSNNPYIVSLHFKENLKYGFHTILISSKKANVIQEKKIFLLPNHHVYIEFFPADTLCLGETMQAEKSAPFLIEDHYVGKDSSALVLDPVKFIEIEESKFLIESRSNPFYTE